MNGWSPYSGMNNSPTYYVDPDGRCPECPDPVYAELKVGAEYTFAADGEHAGATYILTDPSLGNDGWVRVGGMLNEVVVTPSFGDKAITFGAGILNPFVDVGSTLLSSTANGFSEGYYEMVKNESKYSAPHFNSYKIDVDFSLQSRSYLDQSPERMKGLMSNTVNVLGTVVGAGITVNVSKNVVVNTGANVIIKAVTKTTIVKTIDKSMESTH
jgi:hypothetical protein